MSADLFIPLDIFRKITENGCIKNEVEAWLTFLSTDEPERITSLIAKKISGTDILLIFCSTSPTSTIVLVRNGICRT